MNMRRQGVAQGLGKLPGSTVFLPLDSWCLAKDCSPLGIVGSLTTQNCKLQQQTITNLNSWKSYRIFWCPQGLNMITSWSPPQSFPYFSWQFPRSHFFFWCSAPIFPIVLMVNYTTCFQYALLLHPVFPMCLMIIHYVSQYSWWYACTTIFTICFVTPNDHLFPHISWYHVARIFDVYTDMLDGYTPMITLCTFGCERKPSKSLPSAAASAPWPWKIQVGEWGKTIGRHGKHMEHLWEKMGK